MKRIGTVILAICLCLGLCACTAGDENSSNVNTEDAQAHIVTDTPATTEPVNTAYLDLLKYIADNGDAERTASDINNPNKVDQYYLYDSNEHFTGENNSTPFTYLMYYTFRPRSDSSYDENTDLTFHWEFNELVGTQKYGTDVCYCVDITFNGVDETFDVEWKCIYTNHNSSRYESDWESQEVASAHIDNISMADFSRQSNIPDIKDYKHEALFYIATDFDNATIRNGIIDCLYQAFDYMAAFTEIYCGREISEQGFTSFTPCVIKNLDEILSASKSKIESIYPEEVTTFEYDGEEFRLFIRADTAYSVDALTNPSNTTLIENWNSFLEIVADAIFTNDPECILKITVSDSWDVIGRYSFDADSDQVIGLEGNIDIP